MPLEVVSTDTDEGAVVIKLRSQAGEELQVRLDTMGTQSLIEMLRLSLQEASQDALSPSRAVQDVHHLQVQESSETVYLRIFLSSRLFHEYGVPAGTNVAAYFSVLADMISADQEAKATPLPPDGKH